MRTEITVSERLALPAGDEATLSITCTAHFEKRGPHAVDLKFGAVTGSMSGEKTGLPPQPILSGHKLTSAHLELYGELLGRLSDKLKALHEKVKPALE